MRSVSIEFCRPMPDDSPLLVNVPHGHIVNVDGVLYVRETEWLSFLISVRDRLMNEQ